MSEIKQASLFYLEPLCLLFEQYRDFYHVPVAKKQNRHFLAQRIKNKDSIIFIIFEQQQASGFINIYPSYSSIAMQPMWIINDLFITPSCRRKGLATQLMKETIRYANKNEVFSIKLATSVDNIAAQSLYSSLGFQLNNEFNYYTKQL